jgi:hypothetical protein
MRMDGDAVRQAAAAGGGANRMRPIRFSCSDTLPLAPADIAGRILDVADWTGFIGYGVFPGIPGGGVRGP